MNHAKPCRNDWRHYDRHAGKLPARLQKLTRAEYLRKYSAAGQQTANLWMFDIADAMPGRMRPDMSDADMRAWSKCRARDVRRMLDRGNTSLSDLEKYAQFFEVDPPSVKLYGRDGCIARLRCRKWWTRRARRYHGRRLESLARDINAVSKRAGLYVSDDAFCRWLNSQSRNARLLRNILATNETGYSNTLLELAQLGVSNPVIRRMELMTRISGVEQVAIGEGDSGLFVTLTTPSRMHPVMSKSCEKNPKYDGTTPRGAQRHLCNQWAKMRAAFAREGVRAYGLRVAEPHHDGTPHWHLLLFIPKQQHHAARRIMARYALEHDGDEPGAAEHRCKFVAIDPQRGSAAGYVAKYISKAIDGANIDAITGQDYAADPAEASQRARAWSSVWGIRQFQFIGTPTVTAWRELRRVHDPLTVHAAEELRLAADAGNWARYMQLQGGPCASRQTAAVRVVQHSDGEIGEYGDAITVPALGVGSFVIRTRIHRWTFSQAPAAECAPWTRVNNCTERGESKTYEATPINPHHPVQPRRLAAAVPRNQTRRAGQNRALH